MIISHLNLLNRYQKISYPKEKNSISIFENQGISIIQKAQKHINGDYFEELIETKDDTSKFYKSTHQNLLALKKHTECSYLYTLSTKDGKNFSYVIDASDEFYSDEVEKIGTPVDVTDDINEITKAITERTIVPTEMYFTEEWGWIISFYGPIINSQDKVIGVVACDFLVADFLSQIKKVALLIGIASVIFLVVFVIVQAIYLSYFFNKLNDVTKAMNNIATGESDLTARIQFLNDNELGQLSKACNTVMEKLQSMIHTVKESVSGLQEKSSALHSNSETTLNKIATIKEDVSDIDNQVENQNSLATTVSQNVQNLHSVIDSLTNNISEQTNAISQSSTAIEEITANIDSITKNINSMSVEYESIVKDTKDTITQIRFSMFSQCKLLKHPVRAHRPQPNNADTTAEIPINMKIPPFSSFSIIILPIGAVDKLFYSKFSPRAGNSVIRLV